MEQAFSSRAQAEKKHSRMELEPENHYGPSGHLETQEVGDRSNCWQATWGILHTWRKYLACSFPHHHMSLTSPRPPVSCLRYSGQMFHTAKEISLDPGTQTH